MDLSFSNILKKGVNSILLQGISMLITLVLNWYLAKKLGAADYGIFTYAFSWVYLFGILSMLGLDSVVQREIVRLSPDSIKKLISYSRKVSLAISFGITALFCIVVYFLSPQLKDNLYKPLLMAIVALPIFTQILINKNICIGFKKVELSLIPENVIRPLVALVLVIILWNVYSEPTVETAIYSVLTAIVIAFIFSVVFAKVKKRDIAESSETTNTNWLHMGITFFLLTATATINSRADILMLGFFGETDKVGIYNIAAKLATFIAIPLFVINKVIAPYISQYFITQQKELTTIIKRIIRNVFVLGFIGALFFVFAGEYLLNYFGEDFQLGYYVLLLLSAGQLINLFVGPVGNTLRMSNLENIALKSMIISTLINITLNLTLIPFYGMNGAAIATFTSLVFWNIYQFILVKRKLNLNLSVI